MSLNLNCRVCGLHETRNATGWRMCVIDVRGDFYTTENLDLRVLARNHSLINPMVMGAYVCGQHHALVLYERYLERKTFEPVHAEGPGYLAELLAADDRGLNATPKMSLEITR